MEIFNWVTALKIFYVFVIFLLLKGLVTGWREKLGEFRQMLETIHPQEIKPTELTQSQSEPQDIATQTERSLEQENQPPLREKPTAKKPLDVHEGILLAAGFAKREYGYNSYRLEIQSNELGSVYEIWGVDLKRALAVSGANIGDNIRAVLTGHIDTSTMNDGETSKVKKKIWDVTKIE